MARKTTGPLGRIYLTLDLGEDLGPRFQATAERNLRTLTSEATAAIRAWVAEQEKAAAAEVA